RRAHSAITALRRSTQHLTDERYGETALGGERRLIERVEQLIERAHVARESSAQPLPGFLRELEAPQPGAQLERRVLLLLAQRGRRDRGAGRAARAEVGQAPVNERRWCLRRQQQTSAALLQLGEQREDTPLPRRLACNAIDIIETQALQL